MRLALRPDINADAAARRFAASGRVLIDSFLAEDAAASLLAALTAPMPWARVFLLEGQHRAADADGTAALPGRMDALRRAAEPAPGAFGYTYDNVPIYDLARGRDEGHPLVPVFHFLNSAPVLSLLRRVVGRKDVGFLDAQATRFRPGDFLTRHDDDVRGKERVAAYVLGMTRTWGEHDGGSLVFYEGRERWPPRFNALSLFVVPTPHEVERVAPHAPDRLSVTGWLRAGTDPGPT